MQENEHPRPVVAVISFFPDYGHLQPILKTADILRLHGFDVECYIPRNCLAITKRYPLKVIGFPWAFNKGWPAIDAKLLNRSTFYNGFFSIVYFNVFRNPALYEAIGATALELRTRLAERRPDIILADGIFAPDYLQRIARFFDIPIVMNNSDGSLLFLRRPFVRVFGLSKAPAWWQRMVEMAGACAKYHGLIFRLVHFSSWLQASRRKRRGQAQFAAAFPTTDAPARPALQMMCGVSELENTCVPGPPPAAAATVRDFSILPYRSSLALPPDLLSWMQADGQKPIVYVSFGSALSLPRAFIRRVRQALIRLPVKVIWTLPLADPEAIEYAKAGHANIWASPYLPQMEILKRQEVKCFVNQAGMNNMQEGILSETPMVCIPFSADQYYNGSLVECAKIGRTVWPNRMSAKRLEDEIRKVLTDRDYSKAIQTVSRLFSNQDADQQIAAFFRALSTPGQAESAAPDV